MTDSPVSNRGSITAVVQTILKVVLKQQAKGALSLNYLPRDEEAARTGDEILFKHLRNQGRSLQDRLRHGLASLSIAEQCKNWPCVCCLLMPGKRADGRTPALCDCCSRNANFLQRKFTTTP
jgi:hypothetical protein